MDSAIQRLNNWGQELISVAHDTGEQAKAVEDDNF